jgi:hypothetical protein
LSGLSRLSGARHLLRNGPSSSNAFETPRIWQPPALQQPLQPPRGGLRGGRPAAGRQAPRVALAALQIILGGSAEGAVGAEGQRPDRQSGPSSWVRSPAWPPTLTARQGEISPRLLPCGTVRRYSLAAAWTGRRVTPRPTAPPHPPSVCQSFCVLVPVCQLPGLQPPDWLPPPQPPAEPSGAPPGCGPGLC